MFDLCFLVDFALFLWSLFYSILEPPSEEGEGGKEKASLELLQHDYDDLNTRKIKDSLSSFLPDIPGKLTVFTDLQLSVIVNNYLHAAHAY